MDAAKSYWKMLEVLRPTIEARKAVAILVFDEDIADANPDLTTEERAALLRKIANDNYIRKNVANLFANPKTSKLSIVDTAPPAKASPIAKTIRAERAANGLTQQEVADAASIPLSTYVRYEAGTRDPSWNQIVSIAAAFGMTASAFAQAAEMRASQ